MISVEVLETVFLSLPIINFACVKVTTMKNRVHLGKVSNINKRAGWNIRAGGKISQN